VLKKERKIMKRVIVIITTGVFGVIVTVSCFAGFGMSADECYQKGNELITEGEVNKAHKYFAAAAKKQPENARYHWAASRTTDNPNLALFHVKAAWENGMKTVPVLFAYTNASFFTDKKQRLEFALTHFRQLPDSLYTEKMRGSVYFRYEGYDSALAIWRRIFAKDPTPELASLIGNAYLNTYNFIEARDFLGQCRKNKLLNDKGYILLALAYASEYNDSEVHELYEEARRYGWYNDGVQLSHAEFLITRGKFEEAEEKLKPLVKAVKGKQDNMYNRRARMDLSFVYTTTDRPDKITSVASAIKGSSFLDTRERLFHSAAAAKTDTSEKIITSLQAVYETYSREPSVALLLARQHVLRNEFDSALKIYRSISLLFARSPVVITEIAATLALSGREDAALGAISTLHRHHIFTKKSLELFRDLTFKKQLFEKTAAAQKLLEKKYGSDISVRISGGLLAAQTGKLDSAISIFTHLARRFPSEERIEMLRIAMYYLKGDYSRVITECEQSTGSTAKLASLKARAYTKLGKTQQADAAYRATLENEKTPGLVIEYANFLIQNGKADEAAPLYEGLLSDIEDNKNIDSSVTAMLLNNFAWALLQNESFDKRHVVSTAQRAYELAPDNPHILDTYATALIKSGKYKKCITLLEKNKIVKTEPRLLFHLASAYEKIGDINLAVRTYQDAHSQTDSTSILKMGISKEQIETRIDQLVDEEK
jgi:predicted Zn-dependent protease